MITLITGGARSGKSTFAEKYTKKLGSRITYIATAIPFDSAMKDRIKKHQNTRPSEWQTYEGYLDIYKDIKDISQTSEAIILDCLTIMTTNLLLENDLDWDNVSYDTIDLIEQKIKYQIKELIRAIKVNDIPAVLVTNELGMGIVPNNRLARIYRDIAGRVNQFVASQADNVYFVVSGIPMKIK